MSKVSLSLSLVASTLLLSCGGGGSSGTIPLDTNTTDTNITQTPQQQAIERIARYAREGDTLPTLQDYNDAGVVGVNAQNIDAINAKVKELSYEDVDTLAELNTLLQSYNLSLENNQTNGSGISIPPKEETNTTIPPIENNQTNGSGTLVPPSNETKPTDNNQTTPEQPPVEPTFTPLQALFDTNHAALSYQEAQNYTLTQEANITSADGTPEVSYWLNGTRVEIKDVLDLKVGDNNLTVIVEEQDGDFEKQTFTQNIKVENPECPIATVSYAPLPTDPQAGDTFTPKTPDLEGRDGNTTHFINREIVPAGVPFEITASDINYTVQTLIAPYIEGCPVQTETNTTIMYPSTELKVDATFYQPTDINVNKANDTYTLTADQILSATKITATGDGNITTQVLVVDENGQVVQAQNGVYTLNAGQNYTVKVIAGEWGNTPNTNQALTVDAGKIFEPLPEIATPSIANSSSSSSATSSTSSRTVNVPEGVDLWVKAGNGEYKKIGSGTQTFSMNSGITYTAKYMNDVGRAGGEDTFKHTHTYVNPDTDGDGVPNETDQCPDTTANATVDTDGCEIVPDISTNFDGVSYTTDTDLFSGDPIVTPTGTITSPDDEIEYIVVNGDQIPVNAMSYNFDGGQFFLGTNLEIQVKLAGKDTLETHSE